MLSVEIIFWSLIGISGYIYLIYPAMIVMLSRRFSDSVFSTATEVPSGHEQTPDNSAELPAVSLILYARNQEATILKRLENAVLADYPSDRFEVIVGCDGDEDLTGDLVRSFKSPVVRSVEFRKFRGKTILLNECVRIAKGKIIVFVESDSFLECNSIRKLARHFTNPNVGGVFGRQFLSDAFTGTNVVTPFERFENFVKRNESRAGVFPGENSALLAIRKERYQLLPQEALHEGIDLGKHLSLRGFRLQYDEDAIVRKETFPMFDSVFRRAVTVMRDEFQSLSQILRASTLPRDQTTVAFWSRIVFGHFGPGILILALICNVSLAGNQMYLQILLLHLLVYLIGAFGMWLMCRDQSEMRMQMLNVLHTIKKKLLSFLNPQEENIRSRPGVQEKSVVESEETVR